MWGNVEIQQSEALRRVPNVEFGDILLKFPKEILYSCLGKENVYSSLHH